MAVIRIREDGKHAHRTETIERAAEFWDCNKTTALVKAAEFAPRLDERIRTVLTREDLPAAQKREIAETLTVPETYEVTVSQHVEIEKR